MIRHEIARILHALADRLEPAPPSPEIRYVYVYNQPSIGYPSVPSPYNPMPWQSPYYHTTCGAN